MYDLKNFNKIRAVFNCSCIKKLAKNSGKYHRVSTENEYQKSLNDCVDFKGSDCFNEVLGS